MTRLVSIDIAKAICITLVVIGHYLPDNSPNWYVTLNDIIYQFHMPLFMFVSGYLYLATRKPVKYKNFIWKKFQRLMIPYFFVSIIIITIKLLTEGGLSVQNPVTYSAFYEMFYLPVAGFFLWFVFVLFLIFLIVPFFNTRKHLPILFLLSLVLYILPVPFPKIFCLAQFKVNFLYFALGCVFYEWINIRRFVDKIHFLFVLCLFACIYILKTHIDTVVIKKIVEPCISFLGIIFVLNLSKYIEQKMNFMKNVLLNISMCSFTIYLFHTTFEGFAKAIILKLPLSVMNEFIFVLIASIVISVGIIVPVILHNIIIRYSKFVSFLIGVNYTEKIK